VLAVRCRVLGDLGSGTEPVTVPQLPADLEFWFTGLSAGPAEQAQVIAALEACERVTTEVVALMERVESDRAATRRVWEGRRAHWCALLRGE
jgi:hypothetical protein